jgi:hypothetical protein
MKHARKRGWAGPLAAGLLLAAAGIASAQAPDPRLNEHPSNTTKQDSDSASKPENMGTSGWTGGLGGSHIGTSNETTRVGPDSTGIGPTDPDHGNINDDTYYASGSDLKGSAVQFPANRTPE